MAKATEIGTAIEKAGEVKVQNNSLDALLQRVDVRKKFEDMLGKKAAGFISSIVSAVTLNSQLKIADPLSVVSAAAIAASLDLPINSNLGFAALVPYKGKDGIVRAQFQMMAKGFVQLGMRSGQYKTLNYAVVYEGELVKYDRFTGEAVFDESKRKSETVVGFVAYERLLNGFEKYFYMTKEEVISHGKKYSKSFSNGLWAEVNSGNYAMPLKTVIKLLLSKFGILSIEMQKAVVFDQSVVRPDETPEYVDGVDFNVISDNEQFTSLPQKSNDHSIDEINDALDFCQGQKTLDEIKIRVENKKTEVSPEQYLSLTKKVADTQKRINSPSK